MTERHHLRLRFAVSNPTRSDPLAIFLIFCRIFVYRSARPTVLAFFTVPPMKPRKSYWPRRLFRGVSLNLVLNERRDKKRPSNWSEMIHSTAAEGGWMKHVSISLELLVQINRENRALVLRLCQVIPAFILIHFLRNVSRSPYSTEKLPLKHRNKLCRSTFSVIITSCAKMIRCDDSTDGFKTKMPEFYKE